MRLTDFLIDVGRPVAYYPELTKITGSVNASIFLCQLIYWKGKEADPDGWIYKTQREFYEETGLSRYEQETARKKLKALELLDEKFAGVPRKLYFKLNLDEINRRWLENLHKVVFPHYIMRESNIKECGNPTCNNAGIQHAIYTETTTKNTTEIKSSSLPPPPDTPEKQEEDFEIKEKPLPSPFNTLKQNEILEANSICKKKGLDLLEQAAALSLLYKDKTITNPSNLLLKTLREGGVAGAKEIIKTEQERKTKEIERQRIAQKQEAERKKQDKSDQEYYEKAEKKLKSLGAEEMKKIEKLAKESLQPAVRNIPTLIRSKMYEIVMNLGP